MRYPEMQLPLVTIYRYLRSIVYGAYHWVRRYGDRRTSRDGQFWMAMSDKVTVAETGDNALYITIWRDDGGD